MSSSSTLFPTRYTNLEVYATTAHSEVYRAFDSERQKDVALKVLKSAAVESERALFAEAEIMSRLHHPNIVQLYDCGTTSTELPYLSMEFVEWKTLDKWSLSPLDAPLDATSGSSSATGLEKPHAILSAFCKLFGTLAYLASQQVVHGDLKPANVFVSGNNTPDEPVTVKLVDFSLARVIGETLSAGTLGYAAPELLDGERLPDTRSDLYSAGVMLYEALAGKHPFSDIDAALAIKQKTEHRVALDIFERRSDLPAGLVAVLSRLLDAEPAKRFASPMEALFALEQLLPRRPLSAADDLKFLFLGSGVFARQREFEKLSRSLRACKEQSSLWLISETAGNGLEELLEQFHRFAQRQKAMTMEISSRTVRDGLLPLQSFAMQCLDTGRLSAARARTLRDTLIETAPDRFATWNSDSIKAMLTQLLSDAVAELAEQRPLVLLVPSLEFIEEDVFEVLSFIAGAASLTGRTGLMIIAGYDADAAPEARVQALRQLMMCREMPLANFTHDEFRAAMQEFFIGLSEIHIDQLYSAASGNADLTLQLIAELIERGKLIRVGDDWQLPPDFAISQLSFARTVSELVELRLRWLDFMDTSARYILTLGALLERFTPTDLLKLIVRSQPMLLQSLSVPAILFQASGEQLISMRDGVYYITRLAQQQLIATVINLRAMHALVADYLESQLAPADKLAYHYAEAGNDEKAYSYALAAARALKDQLAIGKAVALYERAMSYAESLKLPVETLYEITSEAAELYRTAQKLDKRQEAAEKLLYYATVIGKRDMLSAARQYKMLLLGDTAALPELRLYAQESLEIAQQTGDNALKLMAYMSLNQTALHLDHSVETAQAYLQTALSLSQTLGDTIAEARCWTQIGTIYRAHTLEIPKAIEAHRAALTCYEQIAATKPTYQHSVVMLKIDVADDYYKLPDMETAEALMAEIIPVALELGDQKTLLSLYRAIGLSRLSTGNFSESLKHLEKAWTCNLALRNVRSEVLILINIGIVYALVGNYPKAIETLNRVNDLCLNTLRDKRLSAFALSNLAHCYTEQGDYARAKIQLEEALLISETLDNDQLREEVSSHLTLFYLDEKNPFCSLAEAKKYQLLCEEVIKANHSEGQTSEYLRPKAMIALREERADDAKTLTDELYRIADGMHGQYENGIEQLYFECYKLYAALRQMKPAYRCLEIAYRTLMQKARLITAEQMRESFLTHVQTNIDIAERYTAYFRTDARRNLSVIYDISRRINSTNKLDDVLAEIFDLAAGLIGVGRCVIFLTEPDGTLTPRASQTTEGELLTDAISVSRSVIERVQKGGSSYISKDTRLDEMLRDKTSITKFNIRSVACVPIKSREKLLGAIYLDSARAAYVFTDDDLEFLEAFANLCGIAIENAQLFEAQAAENFRLRQEKTALEQKLISSFRFDGMLAESAAMKEVERIIARIAPRDAPILIEGESGTGKELTALAIHKNSPRADKPFVRVDITTLSETLITSELFGYIKGAFSGADRDKKGLFEEADGGTVFIDEINSASLDIQARLLRVIQENTVRRVGDTVERKIDARIIAASNRPLKELVAEKRFREDLFYRIESVRLYLPPLRDRPEDIEPLCYYFLKRTCEKYRVPMKRFAPPVLEVFKKYRWEGNVRQLGTQIDRLVTLSSDDAPVLTEEYISPEIIKSVREQLGTPYPTNGLHATNAVADEAAAGLGTSGASLLPVQLFGEGLRKTLDDIERTLIERALHEHKMNQSRTAEALKISGASLSEKIKKYGIKKS